MDRIDKSWKELDFDEVDFRSRAEGGPGRWGYGQGGHPLQDQEWSISFIDENYTEIRYKMPSCINEMLSFQRQHGAEEVQSAIRKALDI